MITRHSKALAISNVLRGYPRNQGIRLSGRTYALCVLLLIPFLAFPVESSEPSTPEAEAWLPSFSAGFGMQGGSYDVTGYANLGDSADPSTFNFYRVQSDENVLMSLFFSDVGLATPVLIESVGSVRLIAQAGFQITLSNDFPLLNENRSGSINCGTSSCDWSFLVELDVKTNFVASLGFDFTLPVASRQFHIRSSVEYLGQYIEYKGTAKRVDRDLFNNRAGVPVATYILDGARKTKLVSALGPRLTMEVETARVGNFGVNLFLDGKVYWDLNNKEVNFGETKTGSTGTGGVSEFLVMPDQFLFQINAGFRIVWQGRI